MAFSTVCERLCTSVYACVCVDGAWNLEREGTARVCHILVEIATSEITRDDDAREDGRPSARSKAFVAATSSGHHHSRRSDRRRTWACVSHMEKVVLCLWESGARACAWERTGTDTHGALLTDPWLLQWRRCLATRLLSKPRRRLRDWSRTTRLAFVIRLDSSHQRDYRRRQRGVEFWSCRLHSRKVQSRVLFPAAM